MDEPKEHMSQAEFARYCGVSRAAVSQWKANGILTEAAFTKPDKKGKLITAVALAEVAQNRDVGQSLGNGITTKTAQDVPADAVPEPEPARPDPIEAQDAAAGELDLAPPAADQQPDVPQQPRAAAAPSYEHDPLKAAKLEQMLRKNRMDAIAEAEAQGLLMEAGEVRAQMARISGMMLQVFEGALPDFAAKMAEKFKVPQRDALHLLRNEFRDVRKQAADKQRELAGARPKTSGVSIDVGN